MSVLGKKLVRQIVVVEMGCRCPEMLLLVKIQTAKIALRRIYYGLYYHIKI